MASLAKPRTYALVLAGFALFALAIAGAGLFGVLSYSVAQRTREIGVRSALGARAFDVVALVLRQAAVVTITGLVIGVSIAAFIVTSLSRVLHGISPVRCHEFSRRPDHRGVCRVRGLRRASPSRHHDRSAASVAI